MKTTTPVHASITKTMVDAFSLDLDLLKKKKRVIHPDPVTATASHDYVKAAADADRAMAVGK